MEIRTRQAELNNPLLIYADAGQGFAFAVDTMEVFAESKYKGTLFLFDLFDGIFADDSDFLHGFFDPIVRGLVPSGSSWIGTGKAALGPCPDLTTIDDLGNKLFLHDLASPFAAGIFVGDDLVTALFAA